MSIWSGPGIGIGAGRAGGGVCRRGGAFVRVGFGVGVDRACGKAGCVGGGAGHFLEKRCKIAVECCCGGAVCSRCGQFGPGEKFRKERLK